MSGSNPHEQKGVGSWCPHPLLIFNDCTFVWQILLCTPLTTDPHHIAPPPIRLFTHLLGIRKTLRLSKVKNPAEGSLLFVSVLLSLLFFLFLSSQPFFRQGRERRNRKRDDNFFSIFFFMMLYCLLEENHLWNFKFVRQFIWQCKLVLAKLQTDC